MADTPFRTSPSAIARYFFHDCERFLRFLAASAELRRKEGLPEVEFDHSPLIRAILDSGYAWEEAVLQQHAGSQVLVAPGDGPCHTRRFDWQQTLQLLRSTPAGAMIYQPTLRLPRGFYDQYGIDPQLVTISDNHPDLIAVLPGEPGRRVLRLIDLKRGESLQLTHRVQVLLYALELDAVLRQEGRDDVQVDLDTGGVWLGGHTTPTEFLLNDLRPHVESFLRQDLVRILRTAADQARWHVHFRCEWCEFFKHCWSQMQGTDDLSRLTRLTPWGKRFLRERAGVGTTAQLGEFLQRPEADEVLSRCASLAGTGPRLAKQVAALEQGQPQSHGAASPSLSRGENIGLFLTLQQEPLNESIYLTGLYLTVRKELREAVFSDEVRQALFDGSRSRPLVLVAERPDSVDEVRRRWVRLLHDVIVQVDQYNRGRDWKDQLSLQAYVLSEQERTLAISWLLDSLRDPDLAEQAMTLLFHFQAPELLAANEHPDREVPFPLVVLLDSLGQVLALPVEVNYTLPEALIALGSRTRLRRNEYFDFPLGPGMRAEPIHAVWHHGKRETLDEIVRHATARLQGGWALLQSLRQLAAESIFTWSAKFTLPTRQEFADPLLSRLAFFARYESLLRCLDVRNMRCEPRPVQLLLGKALELEALGDDRFQIVSGTLEVSPGGYPEWLLVRDDPAGRRAQLEFRDYACRAQLWQRKQSDLALVGVVQLDRDPLGTPTGLTVSYPRGFDGDRSRVGERFLLHPRFTDFTTDGVVEFLRSGGVQTHGLLLRLLRDPDAASRPLELAADVAELALEEIAAFGLTESQADAFREICRRRVVPVWGPPGTGKTHFLAAAILALTAAHARAGRPFRVLVTAFTHAAIENLLRKIAALRAACQPGSPVRIGKAKSWQGEETAGIETVEETRLGGWLGEHPQAIVGATVYSCLKQFAQLPPFELSVIDEASQVRVPEAAIPLGLAGPHGRLVLAGDHLQLPPIVAGVYPETEPGQPVLHRSIFEAVARGAGTRFGASAGPQHNSDGKSLDDERETCRRAFRRGRETGAELEGRETGGERSPLAERAGSGGLVRQLTENFRMNDVLTSFSGGLLYGPAYHSFDAPVAQRRLNLLPERCLDPLVEACLDPEFPLVFVVLDGVWAARENPPEAQLAAQLVAGLRTTLRQADGRLFGDDGAFFRDGVFVVSPHRAQIRAIQRELRRQRRWQSPPLVDTVDKMQGREADAVIVSYGVSDPEFAAAEAEFIYGLNRLNVAVTRARAKCIVCLPRPLLDAPPQVLDLPEAARGLAFMRDLVQAVSRGGEELTFDFEDGVRAAVYRTRDCYRKPVPPVATSQPEALSAAEPEAELASVLEVAAVPGPSELPEPTALAVIEPYSVTLQRVTVELPASQPVTAAETPARYRRAGRGKKKAAATAEPASPPASEPTARSDSLLAQLNEAQREAASHGQEPLLIIAGAGTGKTTTLVHRVARLISEGLPPERILLLTFTRRAAAQMVERVAAVLRDADVDRSVWGGTFHGVGTRLLRQYGKAIGIHPRFTIHDQGDAEDLMGALCRELDLGADDKNFPKKRTCLAIHSYGVNAELPLTQVLDRQFPQHERYADELAKLFAAYTQRKADLNVFDYDDLLRKWCDLLEHAEVGPAIRSRFDCVLVDEYQDTNRLQARLLQRLCPAGRGLTVVGDDAQSIYSFRAATVRNIMDFPGQFPGTRIVTLEQNYRSTQPILEATNRVIAQASERYTKELWSSRAAGPPPQLITCEDEREQVDFVVERILEHRKQGIPLAQQAVLFRASHHSIQLESQLSKSGLQFVKYGGLKFVEAAHVKDLLSLLRLAENPRDTVAGLRALCLMPGVGPKKAEELFRVLHAADGRFEVWRDAKVPAKSKDGWPGFVGLMSSLAGDGSGGDLRDQVRRTLKFYQPILEQNYDNPTQRMLDLEELEQLAAQATDRATLLADLTVDPPVRGDDFQGQDREQTLTLSTLHSAKGLEWRVVYVLHATDGKIPLERSAADPDQLEEERRMFYVALTRAADWLYVCHPRHEASSYGNTSYGRSWGGGVYESCQLTRFITKSVKEVFQCQRAGAFQTPQSTEAASGSRKKPALAKASTTSRRRSKAGNA